MACGSGACAAAVAANEAGLVSSRTVVRFRVATSRSNVGTTARCC